MKNTHPKAGRSGIFGKIAGLVDRVSDPTGSFEFSFVHFVSAEQHEATFTIPKPAAHSAATLSSWPEAACPPGTLSTWRVWSHSSETLSRWTNEFVANSATSVEELSIPALLHRGSR